MSSEDIVIRVSNLSKCYQIYENPRDRLKQFILPRLWRLAGKKHKQYYREFWALKDVSFEIKKGETVGIIGRNGSGKSTLLQIICGTLNPTSGTVQANGRIAALLELGSGFNTEFTGRENIYMSATLLGMSKKEIDDRFDDIVTFADIGIHLDQPVKTYSSGMFARLAFAVSINVSPDILVVDEALSVGDFAFQYKCFEKFRELKNKGTTILFVTHNLQEVIKHCNRAIYIANGEISLDIDNVEDVVFRYETDVRAKDSGITDSITSSYGKGDNAEHRFGTYIAQIDMPEWIQDAGNIMISGKKTTINLAITAKEAVEDCVLGYSLKNEQGVVIWGDSSIAMNEKVDLHKGINSFSIIFDAMLIPGEYYFYIGLSKFINQKKIDIDQRWRVQKVKFVSNRVMSEGIVFAPSLLLKKK